MGKETARDHWRDVCDKSDSIAVVIMKDERIVGRVLGRYIKSKMYGHNVEMGLQWHLPNGETIYAHAYAGGCGYNKVAHCSGAVFSQVAKQLESAYSVEFRNPKFQREYEQKIGIKGEYIDWHNYADRILAASGFKVINVLGSLN